jgi:branched-chain amino acid transport system permease protein
MLVASLGILLAITAFITIVFQSAPRPLPDTFGSSPLTIEGANIKGLNIFTVGVALVAFAGLMLLLKKTPFGRAVRAIGDDEEVSKVVGINTTVIIAAVFFIGAVFAAMAGVLSGHDTAIQPRMGLLLLLKGWIASVVGGIGNLYGAIVGGFILGMLEQFGIWDLAGEWKDVISFVVLILFLSFWPLGLLPRK